jgi:hypothetical protein
VFAGGPAVIAGGPATRRTVFISVALIIRSQFQ